MSRRFIIIFSTLCIITGCAFLLFTLIWLSGLLSYVAIAPMGPFPGTAQYFFERAMDYERQGEPAHAIAEYDRALDLAPEDAVLHYGRGINLGRTGQDAKAIAALSEALRIDPAFGEAYYARGLAQVKTNPDLAIADLDQALKLDPNLGFAYFQRGLAFLQKTEYERALLDFDEAIRLRPDDPVLYISRGNAYASTHRCDLAILDFARAIERDPKLAEAYEARGVCFYEQREPDRALADFNLALQIKPDLVLSLINRGCLYMDRGDYDRALADLNQAVELAPDFAEAYYNRGIAYYNRNDPGHALRDFDKALALKPSDPDYHYYRGSTLVMTGDLQPAVAELDRALQDKPIFPEAYYQRALAYAKQGYFARAIPDFERVIQLDPRATSAYYNLGIILKIQGERAKANAQLKKALILGSNPAQLSRVEEALRGLAVWSNLGVSPAATTPLPEWNSRSATPGAQLELVELERQGQPGDTRVRYQIRTSGLRQGKVYNLWVRPLGEAPLLLLPGFRANTAGQAVSENGERLDQMWVMSELRARGEPLEIALISTDQAVQAFARAVPFPIVWPDPRGCRLALELASVSGDVFLVSGDGFERNAQVTLVNQSEQQVLMQSSVRTGPDGKLPPTALLPVVAGKSTGRATVTAAAGACKAQLEYEWGTPALKPQ